MRNLLVDIGAAVIYLVAANPLITGWALHEWFSLGCLLIFLIHCGLHYDWVIACLRKRLDKTSAANLVLDCASLVVFMAVTISGLMVSRHVLPLLGFVAPGYFFWAPLHAVSAKVLLALLLVHLVVHGRWLLAQVGRRREKVHDRAGMD